MAPDNIIDPDNVQRVIALRVFFGPAQPLPATYGRGVCAACGCTGDDACTDALTGDPCRWYNTEHTLCTACAAVSAGVAVRLGPR